MANICCKCRKNKKDEQENNSIEMRSLSVEQITDDLEFRNDRVGSDGSNCSDDEFNNLNILTFDVELDRKVIDIEKKTEQIINIIITNVEIDVFCFQGINDTKLMKYIILKVMANIPNINIYPDTLDRKTNNIETTNGSAFDENVINLSSGDVNTNRIINSVDDIPLTLSKSIDDGGLDKYSLIFSRHQFITTTSIKLEKNNDGIPKHLCICNINFYGTIVSIYNFKLDRDRHSKVTYRKLRENQLENIMNVINLNKERILIDETYKGYLNKDIHIMCGNLEIDEIKEGNINEEYTQCFDMIKGIDIYGFVRSAKRKNPDRNKDSTSIRMGRFQYVILLSDIRNLLEMSNFNIINSMAKNIFEKHEIIIQNAQIKRENFETFSNYPIIISLLVKDSEVDFSPARTITTTEIF